MLNRLEEFENLVSIVGSTCSVSLICLSNVTSFFSYLL